MVAPIHFYAFDLYCEDTLEERVNEAVGIKSPLGHLINFHGVAVSS